MRETDLSSCISTPRTHFHPEESDGGEQVHCGLEVLQLLVGAGGEVVAVHGQVYPEGVVQLVQQLHKLFFLWTQRMHVMYMSIFTSS